MSCIICYLTAYFQVAFASHMQPLTPFEKNKNGLVACGTLPE